MRLQVQLAATAYLGVIELLGAGGQSGILACGKRGILRNQTPLNLQIHLLADQHCATEREIVSALNLQCLLGTAVT